MLNAFQITPEHTFDLIPGLLAATYTRKLPLFHRSAGHLSQSCTAAHGRNT